MQGIRLTEETDSTGSMQVSMSAVVMTHVIKHNMVELLQKALASTRESKFIEFKETIDVSSAGDWCEIIKDIVALTNSGGGIILVGVDNHGKPSGHDVSMLITFDPANITNKIQKYCGHDFSEFDVSEQWRDGVRIAAIEVFGTPIPIVFTKPGTYDIGGGKQKTAFSAGTVYFRHGAKSEPGNTDDLRKVIERQLEVIRKQWLHGVKRVVESPRGSQVLVLPNEVYESDARTATPIRIVDDPSAPAFRKIDPDISHPYRGKEFLRVLNEKLAGTVTVSSHDLLCIRRIFDLEKDALFCHKPMFSTIQYSEAFANWILDKHQEDTGFFTRLRSECYERRHDLGMQGQRKAKKTL